MLALTLGVFLFRTPTFLSAFLCMAVLPFVLFIIAVKTKFISNWDVTNRSERPKMLWPLVVIELVSIGVFQQFSLIPILLGIIGFAVITHFWKISGHAMAAGLASGVLVARFGIVWWPILLIVPLVCWSRVVRKNHTLAQVVAGAVYSWVLVFFFI
jgi:membrane-associated phospholipid phosphatase